MNTGFKFTIFSLVTIFAVVVSQTKGAPKRSSSRASRTTSSPGVTTSSPGVTTSSPGVTTSSPGVTTSSPGVTTSSPGVTTSNTGVTTSNTGVTTRTNATGTVEQINVSKATGQKLLQAPIAGNSYKLIDLFNLINTNNSAKTSLFQVFIPALAQGKNPTTKSSDKFGLTKSWIQNPANKDVTVTIKMDDQGIISKMEEKGTFPNESELEQARAYRWCDVFKYTRDNFNKILLYFTVPGFNDASNNPVKFYIINPWQQSSKISWNRNIAPEQTCRAYRELMNWKLSGE